MLLPYAVLQVLLPRSQISGRLVTIPLEGSLQNLPIKFDAVVTGFIRSRKLPAVSRTRLDPKIGLGASTPGTTSPPHV